MFENSHEDMTETQVAGAPLQTGEILVSTAAILVVILAVYLTLFDGNAFL